MECARTSTIWDPSSSMWLSARRSTSRRAAWSPSDSRRLRGRLVRRPGLSRPLKPLSSTLAPQFIRRRGRLVQVQFGNSHAQLSGQGTSVASCRSARALLPRAQGLVRDPDAAAQGDDGESGWDARRELLANGSDAVHRDIACHSSTGLDLETTGGCDMVTEVSNLNVRKLKEVATNGQA